MATLDLETLGTARDSLTLEGFPLPVVVMEQEVKGL